MTCVSRNQRQLISLCLVSAVACTEPIATSLPHPPENVTASLAGRSSVVVSWTARPAAENIGSYGVYRDGRKIGETDATTFTDTAPPEVQTHSYAVASQSADGITSELSAGVTVFAPDATAPRVMATDPLTGTINLEPSPTIRVVFSEPLDPASVDANSFTAKSAATGAVIPGTATYVPATNSIQWRPTANIAGETRVVATIATSVRDTAGNGLQNPYSLTFTIKETVPPRLLSVTPADGSTISMYTNVVLTFSEPMSRVCCFGMREIGTNNGITAIPSFDETKTIVTLKFVGMKPLTTYRLTFDEAALDLVGNRMVDAFAPLTLTFADDFVVPNVVSTSPANGATGVTANSPKLVVSFDRQLITPQGYQASFDLRTENGAQITGGVFTYDYYSTSLTYNAPQLASNTRYTITLTQRYAPAGAVPTQQAYAWSFTTGP
jgi:hypothetical protein